VQSVSKISNLRDPDPPTSQTDGRTDDMQSQYRAMQYSTSHGKNDAGFDHKLTACPRTFALVFRLGSEPISLLMLLLFLFFLSFVSNQIEMIFGRIVLQASQFFHLSLF